MQPVAAAQASLSVLVSFSTTSLSINRTGQLFCKLKEKMKRADLLRGLRVAHGESVPAGLHAAGHRHAQHQVLVTEALRPHVAPVLAPLPGGRHWHRPTCDGQAPCSCSCGGMRYRCHLLAPGFLMCPAHGIQRLHHSSTMPTIILGM